MKIVKNKNNPRVYIYIYIKPNYPKEKIDFNM